MNKNDKLPLEWELTEIKDISEVNPRSDKSVIRDNLEVSFVPMPAVSAGNGFIDVTQNRPFSEVKKGYTGFLEGDVLFAKITPCMENGKMAVVPKLINGYGFGSTEFHVLRPKQVEVKYLYFFVSSEIFRRNAAHHMTGAVGQKRVPTVYIKECKIPVAPPNEQKRIVAEIEKQFSRLDEAVDNLKRVKANLKRYKASVLKAAVEGKLTEEWRKKHPDVEPADKLLQRILAERRKKWEESESAKIKKAGNKPKDDKWKKKYKEPEKPSEFYLDLPTHWIEVRAEQICDFITKGTTPKANKLYSDKGEIPFIKVYNLTNTGRLDFSIKPTFISNDTNENELARSRVYPGDVLMNIVGPPLGKVSVIPNSFGKGNINQAIAIFRAMPSFNNLLLSYFLLSDTILSWAERRAKATAGQFNLTLEICRNLPIPVPPAEEQITIFKILDQLFTCIDELSNITDKNLKRAERLRQSVLKKAFSGKLILSKES